MTALMGASRDALARVREQLDAAADGLTADELVRLGDDLFALADLLHREGRLRRTLADPAITPASRAELAAGLFEGQLAERGLDVARELVSARWSRPADLVDAADVLAVQAVLAGAEESGDLEEVEDELFRFARLLNGQPELQVALGDVTLDADARVALVRGLLEDKVKPASLRLVEQAVRSPHGRRIDRALEEYVRLAAERRERLVAVVQSAATLSDEQVERLASALSGVYGRQIQVQVAIEPALLGGLSVRVGDELIEGSVLNRLERARRQLAG